MRGKGARGGGGVSPKKAAAHPRNVRSPTKQPQNGPGPHISPYSGKAQTGQKTGHGKLKKLFLRRKGLIPGQFYV